ncbi:AAA family ATPase [Paenibacillus thiaminolyticus]|uniref:AAA family ATPase n=1 Tax=Paenibacillus thiaminolyticus TaxID=49283 RepID=UPI001164374B|nr:ATP-binding protein [Paenibacillus thiaminolyticus]NGP59054.1 AAA family ATPase [Paenibacillus thiaminolyticus]
MRGFTLDSIIVNGKEIRFSNGMNIVMGSNGSGKTTFFNIIMYILGLKDIKRTIEYVQFDEVVANCTFGNSQVSITRYKDDVLYFSGDIKEEATYGSRKLFSIYNSLLSPSFDFEEDIYAGHEILRSSFYSENLLSSNTISAQTYKKILGINIEYLKTYKKQIIFFKDNLRMEQYAHDTLKTYINNIEREAEGIPNREAFSRVVKNQYLNMYDKLFENRKFLDEAMEMYEKMKKYQESIFHIRNEIIQSHISENLYKLGITREEIRTIPSGGNKLIEKFLPVIARSKRYPNYNFFNTSGILFADSPMSKLSENTANLMRKILSVECENGQLQYFEFTHHTSELPNSSNVIQLHSKEAFRWLREN